MERVDGIPQAADLGPAVLFTVDDELHRFYLHRVTARDVSAVREALGCTIRGLLNVELDLDVYASFLWLERRQNGEPDLAWATVSNSITYGTRFQMADEDDEPQEAGDPKG